MLLKSWTDWTQIWNIYYPSTVQWIELKIFSIFLLLLNCVVTQIYPCDAKCWDFCLLFNIESAHINFYEKLRKTYNCTLSCFESRKLCSLYLYVVYICINYKAKCNKELIVTKKGFNENLILMVFRIVTVHFYSVQQQYKCYFLVINHKCRFLKGDDTCRFLRKVFSANISFIKP